MIIQLNPPLRYETPLGLGTAHILIDYGVDYNPVYVVDMDSGPVLCFSCKQLKRIKNHTFEE